MSEAGNQPAMDGSAWGKVPVGIKNYIIVGLACLLLGGGGAGVMGLFPSAAAISPVDPAQVKPICREVVMEEMAQFRSELTLMRSELTGIKTSVDTLASTFKTILDFYLSQGLSAGKRK